jgi:hypothetical protein
LHITYHNYHDLVVERIIHMVGKCRLTFNMLYMIKHDESNLEVAPSVITLTLGSRPR